ncbi:MAG TPA: hypothetical protein P5079_11830, partial [Elusimicrobiota bacterium]|nr:hypothetical protein [Elusimicrobiota bacterium]
IYVEDTTYFPPSGTVDVESELNITYTGKTATSLIGVTRSAPVSHPSNVLAKGPRRNKTYYVVYDIDELATVGALVGKQTELGMTLVSGSYMTVGAPDIVSNTNLPFTASILDINEYADTVTVTPFNPDNTSPTHGDETLQQRATAQVVLGFTLETNQSEATWQGVRIRSTGTMVSELDISTVTIWVDGNRNSFFDPAAGYDVPIGTGSFGNIGETGVAQVLFGASAPTLVTAVRAEAEGLPSRYFVTYDISPTAVPDRMAGARLAGAADFIVTAPNTVSPANVTPFNGKLRQIIPAPQNVKCVFTPLFSSLQGTTTMQSLVSPTLDGNISSTVDIIPVLNVTDVPSHGYAVIDSEIIYYSTVGAASLQGVLRGQLNTTPAPHTDDTLVGIQYTQSDKNVAFLKMGVYVDDPLGYNVRWYNFKINRYQPVGLNGSDADVGMVRIYRDTGQPGLDRNPATGLVNDALIAQKKFGDGESSAQATLTLDGHLFGGGTDYILITPTTQYYIITMDIDPTATFDHVVGARVPSSTNLTIGAQTPNDGIHTVLLDNFPGLSPTAVIRATEDTLQVRAESLMPSTVVQNQKNVPVLRLNLRSDVNTVVWQKIKLDLMTTNGAVDGDVQLINLYRVRADCRGQKEE